MKIRAGRGPWINGALAVVLLATAGASYSVIRTRSAGASTPQTTTVARGTVLATVSASGNIESPKDLGLNFTTGGEITSIEVKVGQHVHAGEVLARVDDTSARQSLGEAKASLAAAEANLAEAKQGQTSEEKAAANAQASYAYAQVESARSALRQQRRVAAANARSYQQQVDANQKTLDAAEQQLARDEAQLATDQAAEQQDCSADRTSSQCAAAQSAVSSDRSKVDEDQASVLQTRNDLNAAKQSQSTGLARDEQATAQAEAEVNTAEESYRSTLASNAANATPDQALIAQGRSSVTSARVQVAQARTALAGTVLEAPSSGTIASISNDFGDYVSSASEASSTGSSMSSSSSAGGSSSTSSSSGFIVLTDLSGLQVQADFAETDAAKLKVGQGASVTVNALPNQELSATVVQIDPTATENDSVFEYGVTLTLQQQPNRLKPGQTVSVSVIVGEADNALYVPSSAVTTAGGQSTVRVLDSSGQLRAVAVTIGLKGDQTTQITSGLHEGDRVVTSSGVEGGFPSGGFPGLGGPGGGGPGGGG